MARDRAPITKQSRREGVALHPKAFKIMVKRTSPPGHHAQARQTKKSQYHSQLREKQKVRRMYGLLERQFVKMIKKATRMDGKTGDNLVIMLEQRLDNAVYRAGFAPSRRAARQLVNHGHFNLNGKRVNIPSIQTKAGDVIELRAKSLKNTYFSNFEEIVEVTEQPPLSWLKADLKKFTITITGTPKREEAEPEIDDQLIVEYYSR